MHKYLKTPLFLGENCSGPVKKSQDVDKVLCFLVFYLWVFFRLIEQFWGVNTVM